MLFFPSQPSLVHQLSLTGFDTKTKRQQKNMPNNWSDGKIVFPQLEIKDETKKQIVCTVLSLTLYVVVLLSNRIELIDFLVTATQIVGCIRD